MPIFPFQSFQISFYINRLNTSNDPAPCILSSASVPGFGVRLTEFNFCGEILTHMVYALAAKIEFCKPDPFWDVYHC
jgi:hypothetical protein